MTPKIKRQFLPNKIISDNNVGEAYFDHLKVIYMKGKKMSTSQFVALKEESLLSKNFELFKQCFSSNPVTKSHEEREKWRKGQNKFQRRKGFFTNNHDNFGKTFFSTTWLQKSKIGY